jgi:trimeric autotransporter adhesin
MKAIKALDFTKGAKKIFGVVSFLFLSFFYQQANGQFSVTTAPGSTGTSSTSQITVTGIVFGKGQSNIAIGNIAINNSSSTASDNVALGHSALQLINSGSYNTAVGNTSMRGTVAFLNVTNNCAFGPGTLEYLGNNSTDNCAFGNQALKKIAAGKWNVAMGSVAGYNNTGDSNTFVGGYAGSSNSTGNGNIALGFVAGGFGTGRQNIAIGFNASVPNGGNSNQLSIQNIIYGINNSGTSSTLSTGSIGIGVIPIATTVSSIYPSSIAKLDVNGTLRIRTVSAITNPTNTYLYTDNEGMVGKATLPIAGVSTYCLTANTIPKTNNVNGSMTCSQITDNGNSVGINSSSFTWTDPTGPVEYGSGGVLLNPSIANGTIFRLAVGGWINATGMIAFSDKKLKKDINKMDKALDKISKINGYTYYWDRASDKHNRFDASKQAGFIAQEIVEVLPEAVVKTDEGILGLNYNAIMPLLAEGIKEQQTMIEELKIEVAELKAKLNQPNNFSESKSSKEYFQIQPNPVEQESKIVYKLDIATAKAMFIIYDLQGKMLKQIDMPKNIKDGQLALNKADLGKGMYILSLIVNNSEVQSKRFLVL